VGRRVVTASRRAGCRNSARPDPWEPREGNLPGPPELERGWANPDGESPHGAGVLGGRLRFFGVFFFVVFFRGRRGLRCELLQGLSPSAMCSGKKSRSVTVAPGIVAASQRINSTSSRARA
jgi:hypothetical protein